MLNIRLRFSGPAGGLSYARAAVRTVEAGSPLSGSILWRLVPPDAVDIRPGAGTRAAQAVLAWAQASEDVDSDAVIDVVELSAGGGECSRELANALFADGASRFRLVVTDPDQRTAELLARDKVLRPHIRAGRVDVARFDPALDPLVATITRGDNVVPGLSDNPLVVVSHGDLGRRPADLLRFDMGRMQEALVMLTGPMSIPDPPRTRHLSRLLLEWRWRAVDSSSYQDDRIRSAVEDIAEELDEGAVPIPIGAVHAIDRLRSLAANRLLLVAEEGGSDVLEELVVPEAPSDGIALPTNLVALAHAVRETGGQVATQRSGEGVAALVASFGLTTADLSGIASLWEPTGEPASASFRLEAANPMPLLDLPLNEPCSLSVEQRTQVQASLASLRRLLQEPDLSARIDAWLASSRG